MTEQKDYWTKDNSIFVCDGWKYGIAPDGQTACVELVSGASQTIPEPQSTVSKIVHKEIIPVEMSQPQETGIMKHRGRPRKEGEPVSRVTKWRRKKEMQGALL